MLQSTGCTSRWVVRYNTWHRCHAVRKSERIEKRHLGVTGVRFDVYSVDTISVAARFSCHHITVQEKTMCVQNETLSINVSFE